MPIHKACWKALIYILYALGYLCVVPPVFRVLISLLKPMKDLTDEGNAGYPSLESRSKQKRVSDCVS